MSRIPEVIETIRNVLTDQSPGPARVAQVTVRRDDGRAVSFFEVKHAGAVVSCEDLATAHDAARVMNR